MHSTPSFLAVIALLVTSLAGCGGDANEHGACVRGTGVSASCGDDFTSGQCTLVNGSAFHEGRTCKDLGFR